MAKKLSKMDKLALEVLANWRNSQGERYLRMPHQERLIKILDMGYVEQLENVHTGFKAFRITEAGAGAIGRADLFAGKAEAAQPVAAFGVGDKVCFASHVAFFSNDLSRVQEARTVMTVEEVIDVEGVHRVMVSPPGFTQLWFNADELTLWTPAEPGSDAKDEYTRDEEQARLLARIRELEEALETIANLNVRPDMFTAADAGVKAQRIASEALAEAQEERG